jgi:plasmid stability protein
MPSITLKDIPVELHAQLRNEAAANFRSITQEAMSRIERTFQIDAALNTKRDQRWIDEAIASGPESPLTKKEMNSIRNRILKGEDERR